MELGSESTAHYESQIISLQKELDEERLNRKDAAEQFEVALLKTGTHTEAVSQRYASEISELNDAYAALVDKSMPRERSHAITERVEHLTNALVDRSGMITSLEVALDRTSASLHQTRQDEALLAKRVKTLEEENIRLAKLVKKVADVQRANIGYSRDLSLAMQKIEVHEESLLESEEKHRILTEERDSLLKDLDAMKSSVQKKPSNTEEGQKIRDLEEQLSSMQGCIDSVQAAASAKMQAELLQHEAKEKTFQETIGSITSERDTLLKDLDSVKASASQETATEKEGHLKQIMRLEDQLSFMKETAHSQIAASEKVKAEAQLQETRAQGLEEKIGSMTREREREEAVYAKVTSQMRTESLQAKEKISALLEEIEILLAAEKHLNECALKMKEEREADILKCQQDCEEKIGEILASLGQETNEKLQLENALSDLKRKYEGTKSGVAPGAGSPASGLGKVASNDERISDLTNQLLKEKQTNQETSMALDEAKLRCVYLEAESRENKLATQTESTESSDSCNEKTKDPLPGTKEGELEPGNCKERCKGLEETCKAYANTIHLLQEEKKALDASSSSGKAENAQERSGDGDPRFCSGKSVDGSSPCTSCMQKVDVFLRRLERLQDENDSLQGLLRTQKETISRKSTLSRYLRSFAANGESSAENSTGSRAALNCEASSSLTAHQIQTLDLSADDAEGRNSQARFIGRDSSFDMMVSQGNRGSCSSPFFLAGRKLTEREIVLEKRCRNLEERKGYLTGQVGWLSQKSQILSALSNLTFQEERKERDSLWLELSETKIQFHIYRAEAESTIAHFRSLKKSYCEEFELLQAQNFQLASGDCCHSRSLNSGECSSLAVVPARALDFSGMELNVARSQSVPTAMPSPTHDEGAGICDELNNNSSHESRLGRVLQPSSRPSHAFEVLELRSHRLENELEEVSCRMQLLKKELRAANERILVAAEQRATCQAGSESSLTQDLPRDAEVDQSQHRLNSIASSKVLGRRSDRLQHQLEETSIRMEFLKKELVKANHSILAEQKATRNAEMVNLRTQDLLEGSKLIEAKQRLDIDSINRTLRMMSLAHLDIELQKDDVEAVLILQLLSSELERVKNEPMAGPVLSNIPSSQEREQDLENGTSTDMALVDQGSQPQLLQLKGSSLISSQSDLISPVTATNQSFSKDKQPFL